MRHDGMVDAFIQAEDNTRAPAKARASGLPGVGDLGTLHNFATWQPGRPRPLSVRSMADKPKKQGSQKAAGSRIAA